MQNIYSIVRNKSFFILTIYRKCGISLSNQFHFHKICWRFLHLDSVFVITISFVFSAELDLNYFRKTKIFPKMFIHVEVVACKRGQEYVLLMNPSKQIVNKLLETYWKPSILYLYLVYSFANFWLRYQVHILWTYTLKGWWKTTLTCISAMMSKIPSTIVK